MPWIPMALSTLGPTSPRLSVVKLDFTSSTGQPIETMVADMGNMLRQIADEIARLEREFKGRVNITVVPDTKFQAVFGALNVRFSCVGWKKCRGHVDSFLADPSTPHPLKWAIVTPIRTLLVVVLVFPPRFMRVWCGCLDVFSLFSAGPFPAFSFHKKVPSSTWKRLTVLHGHICTAYSTREW